MKTINRYYQVADFVFAIDAAEDLFAWLPNYVPFESGEWRVESRESDLFTLHVKDEAIPATEGWEHIYTDQSDDDLPRIEMYRRNGAWMFRVSASKEGEIVSAIVCSEGWREVPFRGL